MKVLLINHKKLGVWLPPFVILLEDFENTGLHNHVDLVYICKAKCEKIILQGKEINDAGWFLPEKIRDINTFDNVMQYIEKALEFISKNG